MTSLLQRLTAGGLALVLTTGFAGVALAQSQPPAQPYPPQPQPYPPPPQYVYPPQGYAQPIYQYPATLPYEEGRPIPQGYHTRTAVRKGLIIGGSITFGVLYLFSLLAADVDRQDKERNGGERKLEALYIPAIGPFIATAKVGSGSSSILIIDGLGQTAGLLMFIGGFAFPKTELVRNDLGSLRVMPLLGKGQSGLSLVGTF